MTAPTLPDHDTTGLTLETNEQRARRAGKGHKLNCLITATSPSPTFRKFSYNFRFDPTGKSKEGDGMKEDGYFIRVVKVIPKEELV